jgi:hypothetical protein
MDGPAAASHDRTPSTALALLAYWSGFFAGPVVGAIAYASEPRGTLARAHGGAAAVLWGAIVAVWVPIVVGVIVLDADTAVLVAALPLLLLVAFAGCTNGTVQIRRGRTALGRPLGLTSNPGRP